jgi:hypothetical protein
MSDTTITLPVHPATGLRALGIGKRGPIWPVLGGSGEGGEGGSEGGTGGTETGTDGNGEGETETVETLRAKLEKYKGIASTQEKRAKENAAAAKRLAELEDAQKTDAEKAADRIAKAEAEAASVPAKVADALREHLVKLHQIDTEDAELFLTANEPELLLKQVARLVGASDSKGKKNHVPREGRSQQRPSEDPERNAVRELFGS